MISINAVRAGLAQLGVHDYGADIGRTRGPDAFEALATPGIIRRDSWVARE